MRKLALTIVVLLLFGIAFGVSGCATSLENARVRIHLHPNDAEAHLKLGNSYFTSRRYQEAIASYKEAIRIKPDLAIAHYNLGIAHRELGQYEDAIASYKEAIRINPDHFNVHYDLANTYYGLGRYQEAILSYKKVIQLKPNDVNVHTKLGIAYERTGHYDEAIEKYREALRINPSGSFARVWLGELEQKIAQEKSTPPVRQATPQPPAKQKPQSGTGSGFFVSKMGHVITNAHVVVNCNKVTIGDNADKQVPAEIVNTDRSNDLALLKLSTLEMASAESQSLIQKLGIVVVPLASKGLLRSEDVRLGEKILVAGYPFGDAFSNSIKVTTGVVSSIRGVGDDSGQFQLDAAVQPGNSGGPIYDSGGNIVGVVTSQLNKRTFGSLVENVNFGVKASTVRQFLISSGLSSRKSERTEEKSTEQLAEIAQNQALMVMCLQ